MTVSLSIDYHRLARRSDNGSRSRCEVIKTGSTLCFAQSLIKADDVVIARASATFRVVPKPE